jgi:phosphate transport system protein
MDRQHTDREYENELRKLREHVLMMGARVEEMLGLAMKAFVDHDLELARATLDSDRQIDQLEIEIDELSLRMLARRQPVASDLRFITTTLKLVTDLERIGDLGVNICERVVELGHEPPLSATGSVTRMADVVREMLHDALFAYEAATTEKAQQVIERDNTVDSYYAQLFPELVSVMMADPQNVYKATRLQSIAKYLERIADHSTNVAEMVVFMVKGKDVRHSFALSRT